MFYGTCSIRSQIRIAYKVRMTLYVILYLPGITDGGPSASTPLLPLRKGGFRTAAQRSVPYIPSAVSHRPTAFWRQGMTCTTPSHRFLYDMIKDENRVTSAGGFVKYFLIHFLSPCVRAISGTYPLLYRRIGRLRPWTPRSAGEGSPYRPSREAP